MLAPSIPMTIAFFAGLSMYSLLKVIVERLAFLRAFHLYLFVNVQTIYCLALLPVGK